MPLRTFVLAGVIAGFSSAASAQDVPKAPPLSSLSCADAKALLQKAGKVVMVFGGVEQRVVQAPPLCPSPAAARPATGAARDTAKCAVGYRCS